MSKFSRYFRTCLFGGILLIAVSVLILRLFNLQVVKGEELLQQSESRLLYNSVIKAARGEILDRYGRPLVTNDMTFVLRFTKVRWDEGKQNDMILSLIRLLDEYNQPYENTLPIKGPPFEHIYVSTEVAEEPKGESPTPLTDGSTDIEGSGYVEPSVTNKTVYSLNSSMKRYLKRKELPENISAPDLVKFMKEEYKISDEYSESDTLLIASVRYAMDLQDFGSLNPYTLAQDLSVELVSHIREYQSFYPGVEIGVDPVRQYRTDYAAHILGRVGKMSASRYEELKDKGYRMDDTAGIDGVEYAFEDYLHGVDGSYLMETDKTGRITNEVGEKDPLPGDNVVLTIDIKLQEIAEKSLAKNIELVRQTASESGGKNAKGGAVVVLDIHSGEILAQASYPTYSLKDFSKDYQSLLNDPLHPMFNRTIKGYPPGSTFKMSTALAALEAGIITPKTAIVDKGIYTYYPSYTPMCWIYRQTGKTHGAERVDGALRDSCNYFFYEVGRLTGIQTMNDYALRLGLGKKTGIELTGETEGILAGPTSREARNAAPWMPGNTLAAAIGQADNLFSPLQLANYVATLTNGGTLYKTHLLKSVKTYDYLMTTLDVMPEAVEVNHFKKENLDVVLNGMRMVVSPGGTAYSYFSDFSMPFGAKTGSAQVTSGDANGIFVAFAPFENPEIAVAIIVENAGTGGAVSGVAKDVFNAYFKNKALMESVKTENTLLQ